MLRLLHALREGALVVGRPDLSTLEVVGPDRSSWLQGVLTNDLAPLSQGRAVYSLALNKKGKIVADLLIGAAEDRLLLAVHESVAEQTLEHLDRFLVMEDAEIRRCDEPLSSLQVVGPAAASVLQAAGAADGLVTAAPASFAGHEGALLCFRAGAEARFLDETRSALPQVSVADLESFDRIRATIGWPRFPLDFDNDSYAQEIGLDERAVSFSKGCYLGQEIVVKMRSRGHPSRVLVRVVATCDPRANSWAAREPVLDAGGAEIGRVTSAARSADGSRIVGFALLKWSESNAGAAVRVAGLEGTLVPAWGALETLTT